MSAPRLTPLRRAAQVSTAALYLVLPFLGHPALAGTLAALRVGPVDLVEPAGALSVAAAARAVPAALALGAAPVLALAVALGPVYCSWLCPFGLVSEGIDRLRGARPPWPAAGPAALRRPRLAVLAALLAGSALAGVPLAAALAPPRLATALPLELVCGRVVPWFTAGLLLALLAIEVLGPRRLVCRVLCPAGTVASLLRRPWTWAPRLTAGRCGCTGAPRCVTACAWELDPRRLALADGCTSCMACVDECPSGALAVFRRR